MPWRETHPVEERMHFMARLREGEKLVDLCREFGISRKTGHKIKKRFEEEGIRGLDDRSRAPHTIRHRTSPEIRELIVKTKKAHDSWGPKKLHGWLTRKKPGLELPSPTTFAYWLAKADMVKKRGPRHPAATVTPARLTRPKGPNDVWAIDFKGQFRLGNRSYCYPLTVTDVYSRFLIAVVALDSTQAAPARAALDHVFREFGVPRVMRSDNGCPFASSGLAGLSKLSVYWLRLGIRPERIEPGHPEQNGQHERMHLTLKQETTRPAAQNSLRQQERFDDFNYTFNYERPHEALGMRTPSTLYVPSERKHPGSLLDLEYPLHDLSRSVTPQGNVSFRKAAFYLSQALAGERVGLREVDPGTWLVNFMDLDLGWFDERTKKFKRAEARP
jgi:transposase InsO family protein